MSFTERVRCFSLSKCILLLVKDVRMFHPSENVNKAWNILYIYLFFCINITRDWTRVSVTPLHPKRHVFGTGTTVYDSLIAFW